MMLYSAPNPAPNPRRVRIYLAEKGLSVPVTDLAIFKGEHKAPEFIAKNSRGQVPALELDDGTVISESFAICRYFEALHPDPPLFGTGAIGIATTDMWVRRVEMILMPPVGAVWVHTHPLTAKLAIQRRSDWGEDNRPRVLSAMRWFDSEIAGREFVAGSAYGVADIALLTTIDFAGFIGIDMPEEAANLRDWHRRVTARPSSSV